MTNKKKIPSIAIVGAGNWGKNLIRNFFELNALKVICDQDNSSLKQMQKLYPSCDFSTSLADVLSRDQGNTFLWKNPLLFREKTPRN